MTPPNHMTLTDKQQRALGQPFELNEHGFVNKNPYIKKYAIQRRLNRVAPGWSLLAPEVITVTDDFIAMKAAIQIGDAVRWGLGTGIIQKKTYEGEDFSPTQLVASTANAYKKAARDCLPRAALEWGIGAYLREKPTNIKEAGFAAWLQSVSPKQREGWTTDDVKSFLEFWESSGIDRDTIKEALNVKSSWAEWTGTRETAHIAVKAHIQITTAGTIGERTLFGQPTDMLDCPINLLEPNDVIWSFGDNASLIVVENWGRVGDKFKIITRNAKTTEETTQYWQSGHRSLCAGPKYDAYRQNPKLAKDGGQRPVWDSQLAVTTK